LEGFGGLERKRGDALERGRREILELQPRERKSCVE